MKQHTISEYLEGLGVLLSKQCGGSPFTFNISICGKTIRLEFVDPVQGALMKSRLSGMLTQSDNDINAIFRFHEDDLIKYLPEGMPVNVETCRSKDETGMIRLTTGWTMDAVDIKNRVFYTIWNKSSNQQFTEKVVHPLIEPFNSWALLTDMIMIHSAAVGVDGKGVLISGWGGKGKSTLSISCLLNGMDFVADDYVMLNSSGSLKAMPIYTMVALNPDMYKALKPDLPVICTLAGQGGKVQLDASSCHFAESLDIGAVVCPTLSDLNEPEIVSIPGGGVFSTIILSSIRQAGRQKDAELIKKMAWRLKDLPVYEMKLTKDVTKNALFLRDFIKKKEK